MAIQRTKTRPARDHELTSAKVNILAGRLLARTRAQVVNLMARNGMRVGLGYYIDLRSFPVIAYEGQPETISMVHLKDETILLTTVNNETIGFEPQIIDLEDLAKILEAIENTIKQRQ